MKTVRPTYRITFTPTAGPAPPVVRLRRLLKAMLRCYGFRAVSVEELPTDGESIVRQGRAAVD
jgi:hypothetical protein